MSKSLPEGVFSAESKLWADPFRIPQLGSTVFGRDGTLLGMIAEVEMYEYDAARLTAEQAAWGLNCQPHDVPILAAARLLKPQGNPPPNSVKFFAASELLELVEDRVWLAKVTNALNQYWQKRNEAKKNRLTDSLAKPLIINGLQE